ncbi:MAG TPA: hypothetical protein VMS31_23135, partial [Pyrinomonadaceae bacterium]|nr:hypothetical protein [Pyrinomonadaceae bacterium]
MQELPRFRRDEMRSVPRKGMDVKVWQLTNRPMNRVRHHDIRSKLSPIRTLYVIAILGLCALAISGSSSCSTNRRMPPPDQPAHRFAPVSEALKVDLFFDATLSMKGFVVSQAGSYYQQ